MPQSKLDLVSAACKCCKKKGLSARFSFRGLGFYKDLEEQAAIPVKIFVMAAACRACSFTDVQTEISAASTFIIHDPHLLVVAISMN